MPGTTAFTFSDQARLRPHPSRTLLSNWVSECVPCQGQASFEPALSSLAQVHRVSRICTCPMGGDRLLGKPRSVLCPVICYWIANSCSLKCTWAMISGPTHMQPWKLLVQLHYSQLQCGQPPSVEEPLSVSCPLHFSCSAVQIVNVRHWSITQNCFEFFSWWAEQVNLYVRVMWVQLWCLQLHV